MCAATHSACAGRHPGGMGTASTIKPMKRLMTLLIMTIAVFGCSSEGEPEPTGPLTESAYSAQGNAICEQMNADLDALSLRMAAGISPEVERDIFRQANTISSEAIMSLFELSPPGSLVDDRQLLFDIVEERRQLVERTNNGEDLAQDFLVVNQRFEDAAQAIWPSCIN